MPRPFVIVVATDWGFRSSTAAALARAGYRVATPTTPEGAEYFIASAYPPAVIVLSAHERWREVLAGAVGRAARPPAVVAIDGARHDGHGDAWAAVAAVGRAMQRIAREPVAWREDLALGVERLDAAHGDLLAAVAGLERALRAGRRGAAAAGLDALRSDAERHFLDEESLMQLHAFGEREEHAREHARLLEELGHLASRCARPDGPASEWLVIALRSWLEGHIRTLDRVLVRHVAGRRAPAQGGSHGGAA